MKTHIPSKKWQASLLALVMPGLGQVFNGQLLKGCSLLIFFIFIPTLLAFITVRLPDRYLLAGMVVAAVASLTVYLFAIVDAAQTAGAIDSRERQASYRSGFFYLAYWLVGMASLLACDGYLKDHIVHAYRIVGPSMAPQVLPGDYVLVTKYTKAPVRRGDMVIHVYPDDRSKDFIRRIQALPGDTAPQADGQTMIVPHGTVLVAGNSHDGHVARDSRDFGPVDMRDIVGQVKQIYFSRGPEGIRWGRIGTLVRPETPPMEAAASGKQ